MTVYADYNFYTSSYVTEGEPLISSAFFDVYAAKASAYINQYTFGNIGDSVPAAVKFCCCDLAEVLFKLDYGKQGEGITSEKIGDITVNYASADSQRQALPQTIKSVVYAWLADTGLLYRGGRLC